MFAVTYNPAEQRKVSKTWFRQDTRLPITGVILPELAVWLHEVNTPTCEVIFFQAAFFITISTRRKTIFKDFWQSNWFSLGTTVIIYTVLFFSTLE